MTQLIFFAIIFGGGTAFGLWLRWLMQRGRLRQARASIDEWQATQPPIVEPSPEQLAELERRLPGLALPALLLEADDAAPVRPGGTRIGGPVWLADGAEWPTGREGRPLEFVAQIDFAAMPPLPDYPETGLLQLFVGRDDCFGADFDAPDQGDFLLAWHPDGAVGGRMVPLPRLPKYGDPDDDGYSSTPFVDDRVRERGVMLRAVPRSAMPRPYDRPVEVLCAELGVDERAGAVEPLLLALEEAGPFDCHSIGGHPLFVQQDFRLTLAYPPEKAGQPSPWRDYDRVLFQLTSRNGLQWGDVGEATVLIRRADLLSRNFGRAIFSWDCS